MNGMNGGTTCAGAVILTLPEMRPIVAAPDPDGPWTDIEEFALTCEPAAGHADLAARAGRVRRRWARYCELPDEPSELRGCLFFEQRRWNLFGGEPVGRARAYATALVRAIAAAVPPGACEGSSPDATDDELDGEVAEAG
jgi:hypothetical protein